MNRSARSSGLKVLSLAAALVFSLSASAQAKNDAPKDNGKNNIPVTASSTLPVAPLPDDAIKQALRIGKVQDGITYYPDGRVAVIYDKANGTSSVYTYQDDLNQAYSVYRLDSKNRVYAMDQYVDGRLRNTLKADGTYETYYSDGTVMQRIDPATLEVYFFDYTYDTILVPDEEGTSHPVQVLSEKNTYLNHATGKTLLSTTSYSTEGSVAVESTYVYATGETQVKKDGLLVQSTDASGNVTNYTYIYDRHGKLVRKVATTDSGVVTISRVRQESKPPVLGNFRRVLNNALKSVLNPTKSFTTKTRYGTYTFLDGDLVKFELKSQKATYYFLNGVLLSTVDQNGQTIIRQDGSEYIRL